MEQAFNTVQGSQRNVIQLLTVFVVEDDLKKFYEVLLESRHEISNLIVSLVCTLEGYMRYSAYRKGLTIQEEIQELALTHEGYTLDELWTEDDD